MWSCGEFSIGGRCDWFRVFVLTLFIVWHHNLTSDGCSIEPSPHHIIKEVYVHFLKICMFHLICMLAHGSLYKKSIWHVWQKIILTAPSRSLNGVSCSLSVKGVCLVDIVYSSFWDFHIKMSKNYEWLMNFCCIICWFVSLRYHKCFKQCSNSEKIFSRVTICLTSLPFGTTSRTPTEEHRNIPFLYENALSSYQFFCFVCLFVANQNYFIM